MVSKVVAVELNWLDLRLVYSWLLCTLRLSDSLTALHNSHLRVRPLPIDFLEASQ